MIEDIELQPTKPSIGKSPIKSSVVYSSLSDSNSESTRIQDISEETSMVEKSGLISSKNLGSEEDDLVYFSRVGDSPSHTGNYYTFYPNEKGEP